MAGSGEDSVRHFLSMCAAGQGGGGLSRDFSMSAEGGAGQSTAGLSFTGIPSASTQFGAHQPVVPAFSGQPPVLPPFGGHLPQAGAFWAQGSSASPFGGLHPASWPYAPQVPPPWASGCWGQVPPSLLGRQVPPMGSYGGMWAGDAAAGPSNWFGASPQHPPPVSQGPGGHGEEDNVAPPGGRVRRGSGRRGIPSSTVVRARTRSAARQADTIANSANFGNAIDADNEDNDANERSSDGDEDNDSSIVGVLLSDAIWDDEKVIRERYPEQSPRVQKEISVWTEKFFHVFKDCLIDWAKMLATEEALISDGEASTDTTTSTGSSKRSSSGATRSTADSHSKKARGTQQQPSRTDKVAVRNLFEKLVVRLDTLDETPQQILQAVELKKQEEERMKKEQAETKEVYCCLDLAVGSGISKTSKEFYFLTKVFRHEQWRFLFLHLDNDDERLQWVHNAYADPSVFLSHFSMKKI